MRVRVRFSKYGFARFLGHLDVMRYFQKAFRRAGLPLRYSEGFHPHPILSFAQPLSLSYTSDGEYFDMELSEKLSEKDIIERLQNAMCDGFAIGKVTVLPDFKPNEKKTSGMSLISGAMYAFTTGGIDDLKQKLQAFADRNEYLIEKTTKCGTKECNLREGVHGIAILEKGQLETILSADGWRMNAEELHRCVTHTDAEAEERLLIVALDAGSEKNISAELFFKGFLESCGIPSDSVKKSVHRMELFGDKEGRKVPLWMIES